MQSKNEVERDWNAGTVIDGLARGGKYFYVDENGDRHEFYKAANGEITAQGETTFNGQKRAYQEQGEIVMASAFKKEIFEKLQRLESLKVLDERDEKIYEKMSKMADNIHQKIEEKQRQGISFEQAWETVTEELAMDIICRKNNVPTQEDKNKFLEQLQTQVETDPTVYAEPKSTSDEPTLNIPEAPGE